MRAPVRPAAATSLAKVGDLDRRSHGPRAPPLGTGGTLALMNEAGLPMAQMVALYILDYAGAQSVTAIASFLNLSPAATSHLVERLVVGRFVGRTEDQSDRRQKRVAITATGRALAARVHNERAREFRAAPSRSSRPSSSSRSNAPSSAASSLQLRGAPAQGLHGA